MCDNIVGISKNPNVCLPNTSTSLSGLWLDDTSKGYIPLKQAFWKDNAELNRVIPDATEQCIRDLRISLHNRLIKRMGMINSTIGFKDDYNDVLTNIKANKAIVLRPKVKGATIKFNSIKLFYQNNDIDVINVYKNGIIMDISKTIEFDSDITLIYTNDKNPYNIKHTGCCGRYSSHEEYCSIGAYDFENTGNTPEFRFVQNDYTLGFYLDLTFECDSLQNLCNLDFEKSIFGIVFAKLVQQTARLNIISRMIMSDKVTAYVDAKEDELGAIVEYLNKDIETMLAYLPENYSLNDCYFCNGIYKSEISI